MSRKLSSASLVADENPTWSNARTNALRKPCRASSSSEGAFLERESCSTSSCSLSCCSRKRFSFCGSRSLTSGRRRGASVFVGGFFSPIDGRSLSSVPPITVSMSFFGSTSSVPDEASGLMSGLKSALAGVFDLPIVLTPVAEGERSALVVSSARIAGDGLLLTFRTTGGFAIATSGDIDSDCILLATSLSLPIWASSGNAYGSSSSPSPFFGEAVRGLLLGCGDDPFNAIALSLRSSLFARLAPSSSSAAGDGRLREAAETSRPASAIALSQAYKGFRVSRQEDGCLPCGRASSRWE